MFKVIREKGKIIIRDMSGKYEDKVFDEDVHFITTDSWGNKSAFLLGDPAHSDTSVINVLLEHNLIG